MLPSNDEVYGAEIKILKDQNRELVVVLEDILNMQGGNFKAKSCGHDGYCVCPWTMRML